MAAYKTAGELLDILGESTSTDPDNVALAKKGLKYIYLNGAQQVEISEGDLEVTLMANTPVALTVVSANVGIKITESAGANTRDYTLYYDDGVGGTPVALSAAYGGASDDVNAAEANALTITAGLVVPAGSRIYMESGEVGTGNAAAADENFSVVCSY